MNYFEKQTQTIIKSVYDNAKGYSLRDRDDGEEEIDYLPPLIRMKLSCRNCENLLLSNEVLESLHTPWEELKTLIENWLAASLEHSHYQEMKDFRDGGYNRKNHDIKSLRNDLMGIIGSKKPWEIAVGQTIADVVCNRPPNSEDGIQNYLGKKIVDTLISNLV